jgi:Protein of unknown function (DUF5132)
MALFEGSAGTVAVGAVVGLAAAVLAPVLLPVLVNVGRPMLKGAIKGAIMAYGRGQEVVGELGETIEDLTAEARDEMRSTNRRTAPAAARNTRGAGARSRARKSRTAKQAEAAAA